MLQRKTKLAIIGRMYSQQKSSSKKRGHKSPTYTKEWFYNYLLNKPKFHKMYSRWVRKDFDKNYVPSVDRKDDDKGYTKKNIRLGTWKQNNENGHKARMSGYSAQGSVCKTVQQLDIDGVLIAEYVSLSEALRQTGVNNISKVCRGKAKMAGGFIWCFKTCKPNL